jgi:hypothetical protein
MNNGTNKLEAQHDMFTKNVDKMSERELRGELRYLRGRNSMLETRLQQVNLQLKKLVKSTESDS